MKALDPNSGRLGYISSKEKEVVSKFHFGSCSPPSLPMEMEEEIVGTTSSNNSMFWALIKFKKVVAALPEKLEDLGENLVMWLIKAGSILFHFQIQIQISNLEASEDSWRARATKMGEWRCIWVCSPTRREGVKHVNNARCIEE